MKIIFIILLANLICSLILHLIIVPNLEKKEKNLTEDIKNNDFIINLMEYIIPLGENLGSKNISTKILLLWRQFCNDIYSDNNFYKAGLFYLLLKEMDMLNYLPDCVINNFKYSEGIKTISDKVSKYEKENIPDKLKNELNECKNALYEDLEEIKTGFVKKRGNKI